MVAETSGAEWVVVVAQVLAAVGALGAAGFAYLTTRHSQRAAQASERTASDAAEALGMAIRPDVWLSFTRWKEAPQRAGVQAQVGPGWAAIDIELTVTSTDGVRTEHIPRLEPGEVLQAWMPHEVYEGMTNVFEPFRSMVVTYSDERRLLRWRQSTRFTDEIQPDTTRFAHTDPERIT
jgi:hypothetical protein